MHHPSHPTSKRTNLLNSVMRRVGVTLRVLVLLPCVESFTATPWSTTITSSTALSGLSIGLGPSDDEVKEPPRKDVLVAGVDYEIPDHEAHRLDRRTKLDERCDEWFTELLSSSGDRKESCFGSIADEMRKRLATVPVLRNDFELEDPNDPNWTPYVSTELPWSILRPSFGLEYYGLPIPRRNAETWRHFDVAGMVAAPMNGSLQASSVDSKGLQAKLTETAGWVDDEACAARLVYVNGIFVPELSKEVSSDDTGAVVVQNVDSIEILNEEERTFLSRLTDGWTDELVSPVPVMYGDSLTSFKSLSGPNHCVGDPDTQFAINSQQGTACFAALNTIQARKIAFVNVTKAMNKPIIILHAHTQSGGVETTKDGDNTAGVALHPRTVVIAHPESAADIVQQSVSLNDDENSRPLLVNGYTQMWIKDSANITHSFMEESGGIPVPGIEDADDVARRQESDRPASANTVLETLDVQCAGADSQYEGTILSMGGNGRVRTATSIALLQPGASCKLNGFSLNGGKCRADIKTNIHHIANGCTSEQLQKNMVGGRSTTSFRGRIRVEQSAQQTDSQQLSRTVLLTDKACAWTVPSLEIIADDVQCTHGATVSDLSEEELFYLQSRGISLQSARNILMYAFCNEVVEGVPPAVRGEMRSIRGDETNNGLRARVLKRLDNLVPTGKRAVKGDFQSI